MPKWRLIPAAVLAVAALATVGQAEDSRQAKGPVSDAELGSWVEKRVQKLQPPAGDKRFDEIGWARDIRHALKLARDHRRPVFLFTHDGRMSHGRC